MEILNSYLTFLWGAFQFDITVFSNPWLYIPMLIPATCYVTFFIVKWAILTAPIWIPFTIILSPFKRQVEKVKEVKEEEDNKENESMNGNVPNIKITSIWKRG